MINENEYFDNLLSIKYGLVKTEDIINIHQILEQNIPIDYLPIGLDWCNNPITLCLKSSEYFGKIIIFYFDRDEEPDLAANSLEELLGVNSIDEL